MDGEEQKFYDMKKIQCFLLFFLKAFGASSVSFLLKNAISLKIIIAIIKGQVNIWRKMRTKLLSRHRTMQRRQIFVILCQIYDMEKVFFPLV